jgi:hypothetical protein
MDWVAENRSLRANSITRRLRFSAHNGCTVGDWRIMGWYANGFDSIAGDRFT